MPVEKPVQQGEIPTKTAQEPGGSEGAVSVVENSAEEPVSVPENGVNPSELSGEAVSLEDTNIATVTDPSLVDIDKLIQGQEIFSPEGEEMAETKHGKKDKKKKSKDSVIDTIAVAMKALPPDEQVATVLSKYAELAENNRQLQTTVKSIQKQVEVIQREKETMETDYSKVVLTKSRLESLCRELQRQNKIIKDENVTRLREEEERRKEVSAKFNTTLSEISNLMKENSDKNNKLRDENQDMAGRLTDLVKQYESRETHVEKILKAKDLQCQLVEAKLAKQHIELTEYKEKMLLEKKTLLEDISTYQGKMQTMSENEITLRTQLNSYMEKYEEFQTTLDKSNKIFNTFKKEMDEMTKKIKKLEKETKTWKERWEGANKALLDMVTERSELEKKMETQGRQNVQLQNLCRALQEQVTELRKQSKSTPPPEIKTEILNEVLTIKDNVKGNESAKTTPEVSSSTTDNLPLENGETSKEVQERGSSDEGHTVVIENTEVTAVTTSGATGEDIKDTDYLAID